LSLGCFVACVLGNVAAYAFGARVGRKLYERPDSRFFKKDHVAKAHAFYEKHGAKALILARFIPAVRVFAPIIAGISAMDYRKFTIVNVVGGALWAIGLTWAGHWLGQAIPNVDRYLLPIVALVVIVSVLPAVLHVWNERRR
jgi:membrane-associated protein